MKKFDELMTYVKGGWMLKIISNDNVRHGFMIKYDGKIFRDVIEVDITKLKHELPYLMSEINDKSYYQLSYNHDKELYQSVIVHRLGIVDERDWVEFDNIKCCESTDLENCMTLLNNKICRLKNTPCMGKIKRII